VIAPHLPKPCATGRPREWPMREIVNSIFYVMRAGCPWRLLGEADLVGIFAHDFDGDQRGRGDLLRGISAVGEDASGRGCISAIVTHILNKSDALQFARRLEAT
jgi:hypothetical protein